MYKNKSFVCIIPARGNSKRIKNKNLVKFLKKPLIQWTINYAKKSKFIDEIYVSTDDAKIKKICKFNDINIINRPKELSGGLIMPDKAIKHAYIHINKKFDYVMTLQPTSPLRNNLDIDRSIKDIVKQKGDSLISVFKSKSFLWKSKRKYFYPVNYDYKKRPRSQDLNFFEENGAIQITKPSILIKTDNRLGGKICISVMSERNSIDIDYHYDIKKGELLSKLK